jgi:pilus assembly protein CpaB
MKHRPAVFAAGALVLAIVTALMARNYMNTIQAGHATAVPANLPAAIAQVVVATQDLPLGTKIDDKQVRIVNWPVESMPANAATDPRAVVGHVTLASVFANEPVIMSRLASPDTQALLPLVIPPGMRAVSVPVNKVSGISGFVSPGTRVDVIAMLPIRGENGQPTRRAFTLLEDVKVLAVAQTTDSRETKPTVADTVTLLVSPEDAHRLTLASTEGTLQLSLRNFNDGDPTHTTGVLTSELSPIGQSAEVAQAKTSQVELIRGPDRIVEHF